MNQEQLKQRKLRQLRGSLKGTSKYLETNPNNQFMLLHYNKLVDKIRQVEKFKTT